MVRARVPRRLLLAAALAALTLPASARADTTAAGTLRLTSIGNFSEPTYVASPPGDASRLMVVQKAGQIAVVRDGTRLPDPFLTVPNVHSVDEQGLLSLAFAPDYATSGRFYVYYNDSTQCDSSGANCDVRVDEYRRADPDHADPASRRSVLQVSHRLHSNHDGGQLQFGPDGRLWAATGDGGGAGNPEGTAQNPNSLLGKLLRFGPGASGPPEVWALGLRNPYRFSFDAVTGDLVLADVGQGRREEVDFLAAGHGPGANFGWNVCEGDLAYPSGGPCPPNPVANYVAPILTYATHQGGTCAITGGYVARDASLPELYGRYLYADFCVGVLHSAVAGAGGASGDAPVASPDPLQVGQLSSFGQDALCRLYVTSLSGPVYRLSSTAPGQAAACGIDHQAPTISALRMQRRRFAVARGATALTAAVRRGTAWRYTLSEAAQVAIRIDRLLPGRRVGRRCLAATRARRARPRCTRALLRGTLRRTGVRAGRRSTPFTGRLGRRALALGRYRATVTATDAAGNVSRPRSITFRVLRP
jgi:glucose/arabinose dehydrogenase